MQRALSVIVFFSIFISASAQQLNKKSNADLNREFAFRVKYIDEFFDRFNATKNILITRYIHENYDGRTLTRSQLIKSLFNIANSNLTNDTFAKNIICEAVDSLKPVYLNFTDTNWFALLKCSALYKKKPVKINLLVRIEYNNDGSAQWALYDADAAFIRKNTLNPDSFLFVNNLLKYFLRPADTTIYSLHPMSHAIDFLNMNEVFKNKTKFINYTYKFKPNWSLKKLFIANFSNQFKFVQVDDFKFYLMQMPGKVMVIEEFNRNSNNSGWLINDIKSIPDNEKNSYLETITKLNLK